MPGINYRQDQWKHTSPRGARGTRGSREWHKPDPVLANEICPGCIVWLPPQRDAGPEKIYCVRKGHCDSEVLEYNRYCHPVLVLEVQQREGSSIEGDLVCLVTDLTTFNHTSMRNYLNFRYILKFSVAIPIRQPGEQFDIPQLDLVSGQMPELTYVRYQHIWEIRLTALCNFIFRRSTAYAKRINEPSYEYLMGLFGCTPQKYQPVNVVLATARDRLAALARVGSGSPPVEMREEESIEDAEADEPVPAVQTPPNQATAVQDSVVPTTKIQGTRAQDSDGTPTSPPSLIGLDPSAAPFTPVCIASSTSQSFNSNFDRFFTNFQ